MTGYNETNALLLIIVRFCLLDSSLPRHLAQSYTSILTWQTAIEIRNSIWTHKSVSVSRFVRFVHISFGIAGNNQLHFAPSIVYFNEITFGPPQTRSPLGQPLAVTWQVLRWFALQYPYAIKVLLYLQMNAWPLKIVLCMPSLLNGGAIYSSPTVLDMVRWILAVSKIWTTQRRVPKYKFFLFQFLDTFYHLFI